MKARHIKKIRKQMKYYDVWVTTRMFGVYATGKPTCTLLARNSCEAARRAKRKGLHPEDDFRGTSSDAQLGTYAVRLSIHKSERFTTYWE